MSGPGTPSLRLTRIRVYPLKGAAGFDLQKTRLDSFGIPGDRRWMLTRPDGLFISQRTHPRLALIKVLPQRQDSGADSTGQDGKGMGSFSLQAPGMGSLELSSDRSSGIPTEVQVQKDRVVGVFVEEGSGWFSEFLGEECRLVFSPDEFLRPVDPDYAPGHRTSFSDGYPLLLTTEESLKDLNSRLTEPSSMLRFRPNLVVSGGEPWEEDTWRVLESGGVRLDLVKPCARCSVTTVDPGTGNGGVEPLRTLGGFRRWNGKAYFGQNAVCSGTGSFRVGETVRILEKGKAPPFGNQ